MFKDFSSFDGRRALVTGGTRGIGAAITELLLAGGAQVVTTSRSQVEPPAGAGHVRADVSTAEGAATAVAGAVEQMGGLDLLVNNAGAATGHPAGITAIPDAEWVDALQANFLTAVRTTAAALPHLLEHGGAVVNVSSAVTLANVGPLAHYAAAKAALEQYSRTLAQDLAPRGVRVNVVVPGNVTTPGADLIREDFARAGGPSDEVLAAATPLGRIGVPTDLASAVVFLLSDASSWVTGSSLVVDGGATVSA
ncbi:oxidoreductase [Kineococcus sp. SYSU DK003]|uniref:oxidoreductase n=1 Tax=Kineococcus sp. SYSU DK003 TaxID=3383124 RepID=UPI003D7DB499